MNRTVTVLIPTLNRPQFLERALRWYEQHPDIAIIVADGSDEKYRRHLPTGAVYYHNSSQTYVERVTSALRLVESEYVTLAADDDLLTPAGIRSCVKFLSQRKDHSSAQGRWMFADRGQRNDIKVTHGYLLSTEQCVAAEDPLRRMELACRDYHLPFYSVVRLPIMRLIFSDILEPAGITNLNLVEHSINLVTACEGRTRILPTFYGLRETLSDSAATSTPSLDALLAATPPPAELNAFLESILTYIMARLNFSEETAKQALTTALKAYLEDYMPRFLATYQWSPEYVQELAESIDGFPPEGRLSPLTAMLAHLECYSAAPENVSRDALIAGVPS